MERIAAGFWSGPQSSSSGQAGTRSRTSCKPFPPPSLTFLQPWGLSTGHRLPAVPRASASLHGSPAPLCRPALTADSSSPRPVPAEAGSEPAVLAAPVGPVRPGRSRSPRHSQVTARESEAQPTAWSQPEHGVKSRRLPAGAIGCRVRARAEKLRSQGLPHARCCSALVSKGTRLNSVIVGLARTPPSPTRLHSPEISGLSFWPKPFSFVAASL